MTMATFLQFICGKKVILLVLLFNAQQQTVQTAGEIAEAAVTLLSTLKQGSLCPGDRVATFTCTTRGTDLTWVVGGRMMSYNINARVGAVRSNAESDETAILLRIDSLGENGLASRVSVLTIRERPGASEPITVQCHNGTATEARTVLFWRKVADAPQAPVLVHNFTEGNRLYLNWTLPQHNSLIQTIDHYIIQVGQALPMLVENTTATLFIPEVDSNVIPVYITAIDQCGQNGEKLTEIVAFTDILPALEMTTNPTTDQISSIRAVNKADLVYPSQVATGLSVLCYAILYAWRG